MKKTCVTKLIIGAGIIALILYIRKNKNSGNTTPDFPGPDVVSI